MMKTGLHKDCEGKVNVVSETVLVASVLASFHCGGSYVLGMLGYIEGRD